MAERPTYQRRGAQLRLPTFQDAVGQVGVQMARKNARIGFVQTIAQAGLMTGFTGNAVQMNSYSRPISVSGGQSLAGKGVL